MLMSAIAMLLISPITVLRINVASASPATYFFVDPPEVRDIQPSNTFSIRINVSEAPSTYSWEFYLNWDRTLLNVTGIQEGDFLHRWEENPFPPPDFLPKYTTSFAYTPLNESNAKGEMLVDCTLMGALPETDWASGDGWLAALNFTVTAQGSTLLNLLDTLLWDHVEAGYPAPTAHPNNDSFFYNLPPPIHDIRISKVTPLPPTTIRGNPVNINVTVLNEGTETEPSVTLNVEADGTLIGTTSLSLNGTGNSENRSSTYSVNWNTAGFALGKYNITASVPAVSGEVDTADNLLIVGTVKVLWRDIAVENVITNTTTARIGEIVSVNVTVANKGSETETFDVTAYYDGFTIETRRISNFASNNQINLTFTLDTTFVTAGTYTIKANATLDTDMNMTNNELTDGDVTVYREAGWPIANFTYSPDKPITNEMITFTSTSYDEDGYIESWAWDFNNDGDTDATTEIAAWVYTEAGDYRVRLIVNDNDTLTPPTGIEKMITVYARPVANFTYSPENPLLNQVATFDASASYDPDGTIVDYSWDFGDDQTGNGETVSHAYNNIGNYTVKLTVTDNDDLNGTKTLRVHVIKAPVASFTFTPSSPKVNETVTFDATSSTPNGGTITRYSWNFGDGILVNATNPTISHAYLNAVTYTATLTVVDSEDLNNTITKSIIIGKLTSNISINASPSSITKGESITISGSITPTRKGVTVTISYRLKDTLAWSNINVQTNQNGQYSSTWTPTTSGTFELKTSWAGDANTLSDDSETQTIQVQEPPGMSGMLLYVAALIIIVIVVAIAIYLVKFRKPS